ncbi:MAG: hypothetical protein IPL32_20450 [Chloracidobacterium sp.]|nr:hypothetical protein [Chloracidobacterium sp.]
MAWSLLDLGPHDEGGLQNNLSLKFKTWFTETLDLHMEKVIQVPSSRLTKYGFSHYRVKKMKRLNDLQVEIECQAYPNAYMENFEVDISTPTQTFCDVNNPCPDGYLRWRRMRPLSRQHAAPNLEQLPMKMEFCRSR